MIVISVSTVIRLVAPNRAQMLLRVLAATLPVVLGGVATLAPAAAQTVRIKDIADFEGVRDNMLVGYGLAVGLNGTGDTLNRSIFTLESLTGMLERLGVNSRLPQQVGQVGTANAINNNLRTRNLAAVMVTATLPPFARQGDRIDVNVSTMGDATSLLGATLLVTPLLGADGEVYAVAQGNVAIGGFAVVGNAQSVTRGVPTNSRIANGAIVEREIAFELGQMDTMRLSLKNPDLTTARRMAQAVNAFLGAPAARSTDPKTVVIQVPAQYRGDAVSMLTDIERLPVEPDQVARVIIDEHAGVIVMGENVRISTVAVAQANLTIRVTETPQVSQPSPFAPGASVLPSVGGTQNADQVVNVPRPRVDAGGRPVVDAGGNPVFDLVPQVVPGSRQGGIPGAIRRRRLDRGRAAHQYRGRRPVRPPARRGARRDHDRRAGQRFERARRRAARSDLDPAEHQGGRRHASRPGGPVNLMAGGASISGLPASGDASVAVERQQANQLNQLRSMKTTDPKEADRVSHDFEAMFLSSMLQPMFSTLKTGKGTFGGGNAESTFQAMLVDEYGKVMAKSGGVGIAAMVRKQILQTQEVR